VVLSISLGHGRSRAKGGEGGGGSNETSKSARGGGKAEKQKEPCGTQSDNPQSGLKEKRGMQDSFGTKIKAVIEIGSFGEGEVKNTPKSRLGGCTRGPSTGC